MYTALLLLLLVAMSRTKANSRVLTPRRYMLCMSPLGQADGGLALTPAALDANDIERLRRSHRAVRWWGEAEPAAGRVQGAGLGAASARLLQLTELSSRLLARLPQHDGAQRRSRRRMCSLRGPRAAIREPQYAHSDETALLGFRKFCMSSAQSFRGGVRVEVVEVSRFLF